LGRPVPTPPPPVPTPVPPFVYIAVATLHLIFQAITHILLQSTIVPTRRYGTSCSRVTVCPVHKRHTTSRLALRAAVLPEQRAPCASPPAACGTRPAWSAAVGPPTHPPKLTQKNMQTSRNVSAVLCAQPTYQPPLQMNEFEADVDASVLDILLSLNLYLYHTPTQRTAGCCATWMGGWVGDGTGSRVAWEATAAPGCDSPTSNSDDQRTTF
jgi:hypothetical protein